MSANLIVFTSNNTISAVGNYRILSYSEPFRGVQSITGITDSISGETSAIRAQRSFRWSRNGQNFSLWIDFDLLDMTPLTSLVLNPEDLLYIEFRYTALDNPSSPTIEDGTLISPAITINSFDLLLGFEKTDPYAGFKPQTLCSDEFNLLPVLRQAKFTFNPYDVNKGIRLYNDLSNMVNQTFGFPVEYYRVVPQGRSKDVILHEWTLFNVQQQQCIKVLVPNNEFPDNKPQYNNFGIDFEIPFEIHIDRPYWETFFGKNTMPQKRDIIFFPQTNRIYEVQSSYIFRDFMQQPLYFKVLIIKYQPKADQILPTDVDMRLDDLTLTSDELFKDEVDLETAKITKPQQYVTITHNEDPTRDKVNRSLPIVRYDFYNNWTLVSEHYYNLAELQSVLGDVDAVFYRAKVKMGQTDNISFNCWFSPLPNLSSSNFSSMRPLLAGRTQFGQGIDIDLVYSPNKGQSQIRLTRNSTITSFVLTNVTLEKDKWYALVVNSSNEFGQAGVDLLEMMAPEFNTTELKVLYHKVQNVVPELFDTNEQYRLRSSQLLLTNIRLFNSMLEQEHESLILNQLVVKDSDKGIIIDNARPLLRLPRVTNPK